MINTAIILAGGLGTRLRPVVSDLPKPMAPVAGRPFLEYLLLHARKQGVRQAVLSVGYKFEAIKAHFGDAYKEIRLKYAIEEEPLGTGGAIWNAFPFCESKTVVVLNGDSLFEVDFKALHGFQRGKNAKMVLSLKPMENFDRYGAVEIDEEHCIRQFQEKTFREKGLINGGVYCLDLNWAEQLPLSGKFSFEKEVLEKYVKSGECYGFVSSAYFIDIGIPADYERAQIEFSEKFQL